MDAMDAFGAMPRRGGGIRLRPDGGLPGGETDPELRAWIERPAYGPGAGFARALFFLVIGVCAVAIARIVLTII